jgi:hypothetical protein
MRATRRAGGVLDSAFSTGAAGGSEFLMRTSRGTSRFTKPGRRAAMITGSTAGLALRRARR